MILCCQVSQKVDLFEVNVGDERFSALYSNHLYAPDPAHPHYRYVPLLSGDVVCGSGCVCLQGNKGHDSSNEGAQEEKRKGWSYKSRDHTHF